MSMVHEGWSPRSRRFPRAIVSEASFEIEGLETVALKCSFDQTSSATTLHNRYLAMAKHQEQVATQLGKAQGGLPCYTIHGHDWPLLPWLAGTVALQPLLNLLEHHCCQGRYFHSIHAAYRATIEVLLYNHEMAFTSVLQEHRVRSLLGQAAGCARHLSSVLATTHERWEGGALNVV
ncbi:hypothetical protein MRX96_047129 [Rhipicephalus microplus]